MFGNQYTVYVIDPDDAVHDGHQAIKAGAADVLYKPLTTHPLLERLNSVVHGDELNVR